MNLCEVRRYGAAIGIVSIVAFSPVALGATSSPGATATAVPKYKTKNPTGGIGTRTAAWGPMKSGFAYSAVGEASDWFAFNVPRKGEVRVSLRNTTPTQNTTDPTYQTDDENACLDSTFCPLRVALYTSRGRPSDRDSAIANAAGGTDSFAYLLRPGRYYLVVNSTNTPDDMNGESYTIKARGPFSRSKPH